WTQYGGALARSGTQGPLYCLKEEQAMTTYMIVDLDVHDPVTYEDYREKAPAFVAKHGGRYLDRGGDFEVIEGDWRPHRLVIFQFPNREAIRTRIPQVARDFRLRLMPQIVYIPTR
ncbi:MAG: DUF1330 domain-containing protein, partial [bacterium]